MTDSRDILPVLGLMKAFLDVRKRQVDDSPRDDENFCAGQIDAFTEMAEMLQKQIDLIKEEHQKI